MGTTKCFIKNQSCKDYGKSFFYRLNILFFFLLILGGNLDAKAEVNVCTLFKQNPSWYWAAQRTQQRWGVSVPIQMSIVFHESSFMARAKPPRRKLFGFIPWFHISTAYGYAQALNSSWHQYKLQTKHIFAQRHNMTDALDFIGWFSNEVHQKAGVSLSDGFHLYLAYHEGIGGFRSRSFENNPSLKAYAKRVALQAKIFNRELLDCQSRLEQKPWWNFWN